MKPKFVFIYLVIFCTISTLFCSCLNSYEESAIGNYKTSKYTLIDSSIKQNFPDLILKKDKTFFLVFKDKTYTGKWKADDNGDWTWINFNFSEGQKCEARIVADGIELSSYPRDFYLPNVASITYKKVK